jgi:signal transduction histidine kinase
VTEQAKPARLAAELTPPPAGQVAGQADRRTSPWSWLFRSMIGQMAIAMLVLFGAGVYVLAIRPMMDVLPPAAFDPLDISAQKVREVVNAYMLDLDRDPQAPVPPAFGKVMDDAARRNPAFRYYIRVGDRVIGNGDRRPRHFEELGLDRVVALQASNVAPGLCSQLFRDLSTRKTKGTLEFIDCGRPRYYEFDGLSRAFPTDIDRRQQAFGKMFWTFGSNFTLAVLATFLLTAAVVIGNMILIRRVARVAYSFDPEALDHQLPEKGLPREVLPLVRATNHLIDRSADMQRRQKFFLSAAAHELRTPLTVLRMRLEQMDESPLKDKLVGDVRRMVGLVNQLLTLMKIGGIHDVNGVVDLVAVVRKVLADTATLASSRDIDVYFEPQVARFVCTGEAQLLETAITNLVENALSFTPDRGRIFVGLSVEGVLAVRDFGSGIDPANATTLFEPFVRYRSNRKGYGLGLAIVKAVATLHGGTVAARNADDGAGAIFTMLIPPRGGEIA